MIQKHSSTSNIILIILIVLFSFLLFNFKVNAEEDAQLNTEIEIIDVIETTDIDELTTLIEDCRSKMDNAHLMAECARNLGYDENCIIIKIAKLNWNSNFDLYLIYTERLEEQKSILNDSMLQKELEYPYATFIWTFLHEQGYNDYVCAGILGNIMCECGGYTLNINPFVYGCNGAYYGMCQWSKRYCPGVQGQSLENQCYYLLSNIKQAFDTYGYLYSSGFNYNSFLNLTNEKYAALSFAKCYERCSSASYTARQNCATFAYNYFTT